MGGFPNIAVEMHVLDGVIRVMGGASEAYRSCLEAFAELDALDSGWIPEYCGLFVGVAAELIGDQPVAAARALRFLRFCRRSGVRMMLAAGIRGAARRSAVAGRPDRALRLWGGAEHTEALAGMRYMPLIAGRGDSMCSCVL
jgi:hypothetical protein